MSGMFRDTAYLPGADGDVAIAVPLTVVEPDGPTRGAIVVLHEARQFGDALLELMSALALEGWVTVAPHLFHREPEQMHGDIFGDNLFADFDATLDWLTGRDVRVDTIGVLGFDAAGTAAMLVATSRPVGAAVSVAARGIVDALSVDAQALIDAAVSLQAPWLGLYGDDDPATPLEHVNQLREATAKADVATLVVSYAGLAHRADEPPQVPDGQDEDDPNAAAIIDARTRIFDWFDSNLR
ncbi:carboxymethylenebutenolidase [Rhodococcus sp. SRB_17]|uniref:dienelactone hydrolase family protein n=1 Tax=Rhodococcus sp. OK302 TaxID=1882769 RepID=UPI000B94624D|nr:dienelactone hydrolase family protein [Rhodococcus sp. OK302]NMM83768.1 carboxymethylenebutenolidase [Rhodococcus sp. SRB_17]